LLSLKSEDRMTAMGRIAALCDVFASGSSGSARTDHLINLDRLKPSSKSPGNLRFATARNGALVFQIAAARRCW
jgi:hypothetical protein